MAIDSAHNEAAVLGYSRFAAAAVLTDADGRHTRRQSNKLREVAPIQRKVRNLLLRDRTAQTGGSGLNGFADGFYCDSLL